MNFTAIARTNGFLRIKALLRKSFFPCIFLTAFFLHAAQASAINGWGDLKLGLSIDRIVSTIRASYPWIEIKSVIDSDIIQENEKFFLETYPNNYFSLCQMQFHMEKMYLLRIQFSKRLFSYNTLYSQMKTRYGTPNTITFKQIEWTQGSRKVILERDVTVKYLDIAMMPGTNQAAHTVDRKEQTSVKSILESL